MEFDLRTEAREIRALLEEAVSRFSGEPVSAVSFTFEGGDPAWVSVDMDDRPEYEPDGTHTHRALARLDRAAWESVYFALEEGEVGVLEPDGSRKTLIAGTSDEEYLATIGGMLVEVLKSARDEGVFAALPRRSRCELAVEDLHGMFAWPRYEDRGQENLV